MPPRSTRSANQKPLKGYNVVLAVPQVPPGLMCGQKLAEIDGELKSLGGKVISNPEQTFNCTHVVATSEQYQKRLGKIDRAIANPDCKIVSYDWLQELLRVKQPVDEEKFLLHQRTSPSNTAIDPAATKTVVANQTKPVKGKKRSRTTAAADGADDDEPATKKQVKTEPEEKIGALSDGQKLPLAQLIVPLDEGAPSECKVFIGDDGTIYDATLNQTNSGHNNNKFYILQLLEETSKKYRCWTRWGRVGERGQSKLLPATTFAIALAEFEKKFKDKNGNRWDDRFKEVRSGKYTFLERNYEPDSDDDAKDTKSSKVKEEDDGSDVELENIESQLAEPIQRLMGLIFNQDYFQQTFTQLNYNAKKMPLGKLSKRTLLRGYDVLKELANQVASPAPGVSIPDKSNQYFSLIPHDFGRGRAPILSSMDMIKREIELLDTLTDMSLANDIIKGAKKNKQDEKLHLYDRQFAGLGMQEMTPLDTASSEFKQLETYLLKSAGQTHHITYTVQDIFRIERHGENDRFNNSKFGKYAKSDRRLLWHGSRCTNFGGILSQGLRIAPPEAPVSGYMFGKGVYLADMSTKSAGYCCPYNSGNIGLLLLCEAELGKPPLKLTNADYNAGSRAEREGSISTWGVGRMAPQKWKDAGTVHKGLKGIQMPDVASKDAGDTNEDGAMLFYNEYIVYDVAQIRLRYLFRVEIK